MLNFTYKSKASRTSCQTFHNNLFLPTPEIQSDYIKYYNLLTKSERSVLQTVVRYCTRYKYVYVTQERIAREAGVCRQYCNEIIGKFAKDGILGVLYRHKKSCLYKLSSFFYGLEVAGKLKHLFPAFHSIYLGALILAQGGVRDQNTTQYMYLNNMYITKHIQPNQEKQPLVDSVQLNELKVESKEEKNSNLVKKRKYMSDEAKSLYDAVQQEFFMSVAQREKLMGYPLPIVKRAWGSYLNNKATIKNAVGWFFTACEQKEKESSLKSAAPKSPAVGADSYNYIKNRNTPYGNQHQAQPMSSYQRFAAVEESQELSDLSNVFDTTCIYQEYERWLGGSECKSMSEERRAFKNERWLSILRNNEKWLWILRKRGYDVDGYLSRQKYTYWGAGRKSPIVITQEEESAHEQYRTAIDKAARRL